METDSQGLVDLDADPGLSDYIQQFAKPVPSGGWVLEGDIHFASKKSLLSTLFGRQEADPVRFIDSDVLTQFRSTVLCREAGNDGIWTIDRKLRITYCLGPFTNPELRDGTHRGLRAALRQIERTTDINYILSSHGQRRGLRGFVGKRRGDVHRA
jgi:hypothetical protein